MNAQSTIQPSLIGALAKALAEIEGVQKNKDNPGLRGARYADLSAVIEALEPIKAHGLWYRQQPKRDADGALIETFYIHESGEELSAGETFVPANKKDPQGFGSALTYCRRYALMTAFGLAAEDDDGHAATQGMCNGNGRSDNRQRDNNRQSNDDNLGRSGSRGTGGMSDASFAKITQLLQATKTLPSVVLEHFNVKDLRQLNRAQFDEAISKLESDIARMAKDESNRSGAQAGGEFGDINDSDIPF